MASSPEALRSRLHSSYLIPDLKSLSALSTVVPRRQPMPAGTKVFANWPKGREETLGMSG